MRKSRSASSPGYEQEQNILKRLINKQTARGTT